MLRELPRTDPALWERISRPPSTDLDESDSEDDETDGAGSQLEDDDDHAGLEDDPFRDDDDFDDDSWMEPAQLMAQILHTEIESSSATGASCPGAADDVEVDLEAVHVPELQLGRGKRRRVATKKFDGFLGH